MAFIDCNGSLWMCSVFLVFPLNFLYWVFSAMPTEKRKATSLLELELEVVTVYILLEMESSDPLFLLKLFALMP